MNIWDVLLVIALAATVVLAGRKIIRDKRRGRLPCGGDCAHCMHGCEVKRQ